MSREIYDLWDLIYLMRRLRDPETGCPWSIHQTFRTIAPHTLEEAYEVVDCIERDDEVHLREELGDLLFQVIYHSQLASEQALFDFAAVVDGLVEKLLSRHPHVFPEGDLRATHHNHGSDEQTVREAWENQKARERVDKKRADTISVLADVPLALPALARAQKLQSRAARVGFDWPDLEQIFDKLDEEIAELREALREGDSDSVADELGDILFTSVNLSRRLGFGAEAISRRAASKFERRFRLMEAHIEADGLSMAALDPDQLDSYWRLAKAEIGKTG